ncbi:hypothetical protein CEXT_426601 [Caerostris extrusa]|uniref:Uncharacterized protein n=1 Tax=Caerostris extrusa TaxID=172846 RepID=A0AAV4Y203_CAEEX|nr:hypothetical protein CEXT_426601 [Caerostris extrusa]
MPIVIEVGCRKFALQVTEVPVKSGYDGDVPKDYVSFGGNEFTCTHGSKDTNSYPDRQCEISLSSSFQKELFRSGGLKKKRQTRTLNMDLMAKIVSFCHFRGNNRVSNLTEKGQMRSSKIQSLSSAADEHGTLGHLIPLPETFYLAPL